MTSECVDLTWNDRENLLSSVPFFTQIFYCFGSWLELRSFPSDVIANSQLLNSVFETLVS